MEIEIKDERLEKMLDTPERIKAHFRKHKTWYIAGGTFLLSAAITTLVMKRKNIASPGAGLISGPGAGLDLIDVHPLSILSKQNVNVNTTIHRGNQGPPSIIVGDIDTQDVWLSITDASLKTGIPQSVIRKHLNGEFPDANGRHLEKLGLAFA